MHYLRHCTNPVYFNRFEKTPSDQFCSEALKRDIPYSLIPALAYRLTNKDYSVTDQFLFVLIATGIIGKLSGHVFHLNV